MPFAAALGGGDTAAAWSAARSNARNDKEKAGSRITVALASSDNPAAYTTARHVYQRLAALCLD